MITKILNFKGVHKLKKNEQGNINGGSQDTWECKEGRGCDYGYRRDKYLGIICCGI
ncbi:hypothetical protein IWQ47_003817 [Aquimarina sp. EL_43]|uniref:hypothetical protein n=1 Tax=unclassified Aquimarina TaxID=2627091 RepID=UPI0018CB4741|nr:MULTISPECIES: hypothetical protein [unclassified Aquimarina]MBG6132592.1 hypothetical protein [Aquimarina sp. EL_35]MBG6152723.1 hypothetical protein [Aquimarina sp. EL_32]MBG6170730.1 hypothetical protein [Aquimarina sp. EL_43]